MVRRPLTFRLVDGCRSRAWQRQVGAARRLLTGLSRTRTLDSHASRLRNRLREAGAPGLVVNTRGVGYRLRDRPDLAALPALDPASKVA